MTFACEQNHHARSLNRGKRVRIRLLRKLLLDLLLPRHLRGQFVLRRLRLLVILFGDRNLLGPEVAKQTARPSQLILLVERELAYFIVRSVHIVQIRCG